MRIKPLAPAGLLQITWDRFEDERGCFMESWNRSRYLEAGFPPEFEFVQDNLSISHKGVLRGLHFQDPYPQGKLVTVISGHAFDVAVDLRRDSSTFGHWAGLELSFENRTQLFIPPGFAHGFLSLRDDTILQYKCTEVYHPEAEKTLRWDDPDIGIQWPLSLLLSQDQSHLFSLREAAPGQLIRLSPKDAAGSFLKELFTGEAI